MRMRLADIADYPSGEETTFRIDGGDR
jgi:hypothetical protein